MDPRLYKAATQGNVQVVKHLIQDDPKVLNSSTPQENTAPHIVARLGHKHFAEEILKECNPLLVRKNIDEDTPLHVAARTGRVDIVTMLINYSIYWPTDIEGGEAGGPLKITNKMHDTALNKRNNYSQIAKELLYAEPSTGHIMNVKKETPLHIAAREGLKDLVWEILRHPWDKGREEEEPSLPKTGSPLHQAVLGGHCGKC